MDSVSVPDPSRDPDSSRLTISVDALTLPGDRVLEDGLAVNDTKPETAQIRGGGQRPVTRCVHTGYVVAAVTERDDGRGTRRQQDLVLPARLETVPSLRTETIINTARSPTVKLIAEAKNTTDSSRERIAVCEVRPAGGRPKLVKPGDELDNHLMGLRGDDLHFSRIGRSESGGRGRRDGGGCGLRDCGCGRCLRLGGRRGVLHFSHMA